MKKWTLNSWRNYPVKHIPKYEDEEGFDFSISKLKSGEHRLIAGCKTHLTFVYRDDSQSDEYDDDLDLEIMAEKEGEL